ncbi:class II fructose-bisphosphate aldolase [Pseudomethylobacillus aquaticus]|uniref:class II fructose-bisphosphate aldolase n=1 Tax=Pseudomethylobacillus aquaticus TaxID=2676064 RepID=UPI001390599C|nr:class II fructose-bisphosphate aldolase [Pseudomethylobacillus aquaticus]
MGSKLDFIKRNIPSEIVSLEALEELIKMTKSTVQIRDVCVHGVLNSYNQHEIEIGKINGTKDGHDIEIFTIDMGRLESSTKALSILQAHWGAISTSLYSTSRNG